VGVAVRLQELNAEVRGDDTLVFDCPCGQCGSKVRLFFGSKQIMNGKRCVFEASGEFPDTFSLKPAIRLLAWFGGLKACRGWHGWVTGGEVVVSD
jgi:hypothetical protein